MLSSLQLIFLVGLLTELYLAAEDTFQITEVGKIVDVKIERKQFVLSEEAKELFAKIHDEWEMEVCRRFENDSLVSGTYYAGYIAKYFPFLKAQCPCGAAQARTKLEIGGGENTHVFVFTAHKNNRSQKKLIGQNTNA